MIDNLVFPLPDSPEMRSYLAMLAKHMIDLEALAGPSFSTADAVSQHQKPEGSAPAGDPRGVAAINDLNRKTRMHLRTCAEIVRKAHMTAEEREADRMNAAYARKLRREIRVRDGHLVSVAFGKKEQQ